MMDTDKMSTASSIGVERRPLLQALIIERRALFIVSFLVFLSSFVWIAAVCTNHWVSVYSENDCIVLKKTNRCFYYGNSGLWETCRRVWIPPKDLNANTDPNNPSNVMNNTNADNNSTNASINEKVVTKPKNIPIYLSTEVINNTMVFVLCTNYLSSYLEKNPSKDGAYHPDVASFSRMMLSFAIISLFVMTMGVIFSAYTFRNPRYMFKRLAAGIHFISTSCTFVVMQLLMSTLDFLKTKVKVVYPDGAYHTYGASFFLGWFVVLMNFAAAAAFLLYSRKRKGNKAATDELAMADEPTIIGR